MQQWCTRFAAAGADAALAGTSCCRSDVDLEITKWDVQAEAGTLEAHWRFSAILDLPWKPRLAAAGGQAGYRLHAAAAAVACARHKQ
jgi:hypothetical protein